MQLAKLLDLPSLFPAKWVGLGATYAPYNHTDGLKYYYKPLRVFEIKTINRKYFYLFVLDIFPINETTLLELLRVFNSTYSFEHPYHLFTHRYVRGTYVRLGINLYPVVCTLFQNSQRIHPAKIIKAMKNTMDFTYWQPNGGICWKIKNKTEQEYMF